MFEPVGYGRGPEHDRQMRHDGLTRVVVTRLLLSPTCGAPLTYGSESETKCPSVALTNRVRSVARQNHHVHGLVWRAPKSPGRETVERGIEESR